MQNSFRISFLSKPVRRKMGLFFVALFSLLFARCNSPGHFINRESRGHIRIMVDNLRGDGEVYLALYDSKESFETRDHFAAAAYRKPVEGRALFVLSGQFVPGRYAVAVYQDENRNGILDINEGGLPLEGFGFSKVLNLAWGMPGWDLASFDVDGSETSIKIGLMHADY